MSNPLKQRGWKGFAVAFVIFFVVGLLFWRVVPEADGAAASPPRTEQEFVDNFKMGAYDRWPARARYAASFKSDYRAAARAAWVKREKRRAEANPDYSPKPFDFTGTWSTFRSHDTCRSPITNVPDCHYAYPKLGPAYDERWATQQKWTVRVLYCGTVGVATFWTGGTLAAALGSGSALCFAGLYVD